MTLVNYIIIIEKVKHLNYEERVEISWLSR